MAVIGRDTTSTASLIKLVSEVPPRHTNDVYISYWLLMIPFIPISNSKSTSEGKAWMQDWQSRLIKQGRLESNGKGQLPLNRLYLSIEWCVTKRQTKRASVGGDEASIPTPSSIFILKSNFVEI